MSRIQSDLFAPDRQSDLSDEHYTPVVFRPDPDKVRARLHKMLAEARAAPKQIEAELVEAETKTVKPNFPKAPADQVTTLRALLAASGKPIRAGELARRFKQGKRVEDRVSELLQIMAAIGQAQTENGSRYFSVR